VSDLPRHVHSHLAFAIFFGRFTAAELMLTLGFDPSAPGMDGGSALHAACWVGHLRLVERILARATVPVDSRDSTHGSTPLGWAAFGSVHRRAPGADYPGVIDRLVAAGADVTAPGNRDGETLLEMADTNRAVQETLRRHGAR
jgi:ankyrin repeat protein